jgi:hypothetical protein
MTRRAVAVDRTLVFLLGIALAALGLAAVAWQRGVLAGGRAVQTTAPEVVASTWWPWGSGAVGLVLILVGLRWLLAHHWPLKASRVTLGGDDALTADPGAVASAAATALAAEPQIAKAHGAATVYRGTSTVTLTATVPARNLRDGVRAADATAQTVAAMLGDTVAVRSIVKTSTRRAQRVE